jgi:SWI/SNF-related matrix-associated actin-dependent regulator of chromatin subfamily A-like protein 1
MNTKKEIQQIPAFVFNKLMKHQAQVIEFAHLNNGRLYIADDMGTGKSITAFCVAFTYKNEWPLLIICPSSLQQQWYTEIKSWFYPIITQLDIFLVQSKEINLNFDDQSVTQKFIVICSYDRVAKLSSNYDYKVVIIDESHFIKNNNTKRFKSILLKFKSANRIVLMSGTPLSGNSFRELINQYKIYEYNNLDLELKLPNVKIPKPINLIQRFKQDISDLEELPKKSRQILKVNIDSNVYQEKFKQLRLFSNINIIHWEIECSKLKVSHFLDQYYDLLFSLDKVLCYYKHNDIADIFYEKFKDVTIVINGRISMEKRNFIIKDFATNDSYKFLLIQIKVGNCGLNLSSVNKIIFLQLDWNPNTLLQAEDRIHRIGQKSKCTVYYVVTDKKWLIDTERIIPRLMTKLNFLVDSGYTMPSNKIFS